MFYQAFDLQGAPDVQITPLVYELDTGFFQKRRYLSRDENKSVRYAGDITDPIHNLGFLESTAALPTFYSQRQPISMQLPINLNYQSGDYFYVDESYQLYPVEVTEVFDPSKQPGWFVQVEQLHYFENTAGGALPSTIERVAPYTPLVTANFNNNLDSTINNLQAFADAVDNMDIGRLRYRGAWASGTAYVYRDCVDRSGVSYVCILANTGWGPPNATYWALAPAVGATGPAGPAGAQGAPGAKGDTGAAGAMAPMAQMVRQVPKVTRARKARQVRRAIKDCKASKVRPAPQGRRVPKVIRANRASQVLPLSPLTQRQTVSRF